ncbi:MAG: PspA/IM30 family protein [Planctomycetaceae bacterium]
MPHFSRLTDIITCSLTEILDAAADPAKTLQEIIGEMHEGLAACRRNVQTSTGNGERMRREISDYEAQIVVWKDRARRNLAEGDEDAARNSLRRKVEIVDLIAGLRPELEAAVSASQHMLRIQKALEARHSEALRRLEELTGQSPAISLESETSVLSSIAANQKRRSAVEAELEALRREMQQ